ncbi:hypothetical protein RJT34_13236 [Clitoria ternatea]|uniref:Uncharacterized protein n=1 Tax=Clitoria ternatea TaxID=43366 RepID=A0AAN9JRR1_CLITE
MGNSEKENKQYCCCLAVVYCCGTRQPSLTFRSVGRGLLRVLYTAEVRQEHCQEPGYVEAEVHGVEEGGVREVPTAISSAFNDQQE